MIFLLSLSFKLPTALSRQARPANWPNGTSPARRTTVSREGRRDDHGGDSHPAHRALPGLPLCPHEVRGQTLLSSGCGALQNLTPSLASRDSHQLFGLCQPQRFQATPPCMVAPTGERELQPHHASRPSPNTSRTQVPQFLQLHLHQPTNPHLAGESKHHRVRTRVPGWESCIQHSHVELESTKSESH